jgi:hypothetical protein
MVPLQTRSETGLLGRYTARVLVQEVLVSTSETSSKDSVENIRL